MKTLKTLKRIPTGFCRKAQGCTGAAGATLGDLAPRSNNSEGVATLTLGRNPFGVERDLLRTDPGWRVPRDPGLEDKIPLGLCCRAPGLKSSVPHSNVKTQTTPARFNVLTF
ncbi:MAG TPA: hypothetical protein VFE51_06940 [Verrucomicrobiae bacterium]|nr:hypothetical protein [Verrucomicrobiae bacterium]